MIWNSILYFNNSPGDQIGTRLANVRYSDVQGPLGWTYPGTGNINVNPLFGSATDLTLDPGSLCVDAGDPNSFYDDVCFPPSQGGSRNDMGKEGGWGACPGDERGVASVDESVGSPRIALAVCPNPTRSEARISFVIPQEDNVKVGIWDVQGREVARLLDQRLAPGAYTVKWNGRGRDADMNPGVYLVRLRTQSRTEVRRLALIR